MAERLGSGLQNHLQRFESARDLENKNPINCYSVGWVFWFIYLPQNLPHNIYWEQKRGSVASVYFVAFLYEKWNQTNNGSVALI